MEESLENMPSEDLAKQLELLSIKNTQGNVMTVFKDLKACHVKEGFNLFLLTADDRIGEKWAEVTGRKASNLS